MDPDACFRQFINAICDNDLEVAAESLANLRTWMERGGALPKFPDAHVPALFVRNLGDYLQALSNLLGNDAKEADDPWDAFVAWSGGFEPESEEDIERYLNAQFGDPGSSFYEHRLAFEAQRAKTHAQLLEGLIERMALVAQLHADHVPDIDDIRAEDRFFQQPETD